MNPKNAVIQVRNLVKHYGPIEAVNGITFDVYEGEIFGLLGPNGAGKTTTLEIIETLREKTSGEIFVQGLAVEKNANEIKQFIGVQLQAAGYYPSLTLLELLRLFSGLYNVKVNPMDMLKSVGLEDKCKAKYKELSGGQKQRFSICTTLINTPKIIFLDEPTTGLDPQARRNLWELIRQIRDKGTTVVITTHYMDEAENLCDRVAIVEKGKIIALSSPDKLIDDLISKGFERKKEVKRANLKMYSCRSPGKNGEMNNVVNHDSQSESERNKMTGKKKYSQLKAMLAITRASLRSTTRSPSAVVFTLAFPLIFIIVFGFIGGGVFSVDVAVKKECDTNNPVYQALVNVPVVKLDTSLSEADMKTNLEKGRIDATLLIRNNKTTTNPQYTVFIETTNASRERGNVLKSVLNNIFFTMNVELAKIPTIAELKETEVSVREYKSIDFILPGQLGFSLLSSGVFGTAFVFLSLRQTLVIKRFFATPIQRPFIVLGEALSRLVFALIGALIIILIGHFAFGFTLIHGFATVINMLLLSTLGLIVFMGFGFAVSGIAKNESAVPPIANIVTLPQFLLSGTFFSISVFPTWLQPVCKALPLTYLNDAMRKVAFEGASLFSVGHQIGIVAAWGVAIYILAVRVFRWE